MKNLNRLLLLSFALTVVTGATAFAAPGAGKKAPTPRDVEVDTVKEAYWNRSSDGEIEVVQNRMFSKKHRLTLQIAAGTSSTDPFLDVKSLSGALGFHFSETLGVNAIYKKYIVSNSSYLNELQSGLITGANSTANTNKPNAFYGGEIEYSPLYGKISLSGSSIVHYDAHLLFGAGITDTESGKYFTPSVGFGPQFYLGSGLALRLDYRLAVYKETIPEKVLLSRPNAGERTNFNHQIALGVEVLL